MARVFYVTIETFRERRAASAEANVKSVDAHAVGARMDVAE